MELGKGPARNSTDGGFTEPILRREADGFLEAHPAHWREFCEFRLSFLRATASYLNQPVSVGYPSGSCIRGRGRNG